jgi:fatty-acyl-CoA synthase
MLGAARSLLSAVARPVLPRPQLLVALARAPFGQPGMDTPVALHAAARPNDVAVVDDDGPVTWAQLDARTNRLANALLTRADDGHDRVAFGLRNSREAIECYTGCARAGLTAVPLNTWARAEELRHVLDEQRPAVVITDAELARRLPPGTDVLLVGSGESYERALDNASAHRPRPRGAPRVVTLTSGTTGRPKGAERTVSISGLQPLIGLLDKVPLRASDTVLLATPLFHAFAQGMLAIALILGNRIVVTRRFDPEQTAGTIDEQQVTVAAFVPVMLKRITDVGRAAPSLRIVVVSGSALAAAVRDRATALWGPIVYDLYGSTEVGWATIATPDDHARHPDTVGRPGRGMRVLAVSEEGRILPPGEVGELHVATGWEFEGYTGGQPSGREVDGALGTGDLGWVDDDGYVFVSGRRDDMVVTGGENVYPAEVEAVIEEHPKVAECAVVGDDDEEYGQLLHAYVVPTGELTEEQVITHARDRLASYKAPRTVTFLDALPRNAAGKVLRRRLG